MMMKRHVPQIPVRSPSPKWGLADLSEHTVQQQWRGPEQWSERSGQMDDIVKCCETFMCKNIYV